GRRVRRPHDWRGACDLRQPAALDRTDKRRQAARPRGNLHDARRRGLPSWGARRCLARPPISPRFSPARLRSGARGSNYAAVKLTKSGSPPPHVRGNAMKLRRRNFLHLAAGAAALPAVSRVTWAQAYPSRPVRIIVGFTAGSATDITAR